VSEAFDELEEGNEEALKAEYERQVCRDVCAAIHVACLCCPLLLAARAHPSQHQPNQRHPTPPPPPPPARCRRHHHQVTQLVGLIELINGDLSKLDRKKLITLCTIDVHARDVVQRLIGECVHVAGWRWVCAG
jgi:hypothetical protein